MGKHFVCTKDSPIVKTSAGKIRGFILDGTYTFHGIKYADAKRFQPPTPVKPWEGIKDALAYGYVSPLLRQDTPTNEVMIPHRYWPMDENCQYLNIWTRSIEPGVKKPVMVWLHGGGYIAGSSIEQVAYDGANLCEYGDVVVVSLNHRLNILGYLDLSAFGEKYKNSSNAGNADIVAALQWIHENIVYFGGDPDNVTLFGQSGGGMKVWNLMQTPAADGLFHKGIIQSGCIDHYMEPTGTDTSRIGKALLKELHLESVEELETAPYALLAEAYLKVAPDIQKEGVYAGCTPLPNDWYLGDPCEVGFTEHAKTIPVMIGSVLGEFSFMPALSPQERQDTAAIDSRLTAKYGAAAEELKRLFAEVYPNKDPSDLLFLDSIVRHPTSEFVRKKAACAESKTYSYLFTYTFPFDDQHIAWHCCEIPFVFHNTALTAAYHEEGITDRLEMQMCDAWLSFARFGKPFSDLLPDWAACTADIEAVMIFDKDCTLRSNHDHELIEQHYKACTPIHFGISDEDEEQNIQH